MNRPSDNQLEHIDITHCRGCTVVIEESKAYKGPEGDLFCSVDCLKRFQEYTEEVTV